VTTGNVSAIIFCLIAGCSSAPVRPASTPPPLPPMPPGWEIGAATAKLVFPGNVISAFSPASVAPADPIIEIFKWDSRHYGVWAAQTNEPGGTMQFYGSGCVEGPYSFLGDPGWLATGQGAMVFVPSDWLPTHSFFVSVHQTASAQPTGFAPASLGAGRFVRRGCTFIEMTPPGTQFPVYRGIVN